MNIGENIKKFRIEQHLTQKQLAEMAGIAEITVRQYESGKRIPKSIPLLSIADALNVSPYDLEGIPEPQSYDDGKISFIDSNGKVTLKADPLELQKVVNKMAGKVHPNKTSLIVEDFEKLNYKGQNEALRQVKLLTKIPEYRKDNPNFWANAAHERTDVEITPEDRAADEDMLDD